MTLRIFALSHSHYGNIYIITFTVWKHLHNYTSHSGNIYTSHYGNKHLHVYTSHSRKFTCLQYTSHSWYIYMFTPHTLENLHVYSTPHTLDTFTCLHLKLWKHLYVYTSHFGNIYTHRAHWRLNSAHWKYFRTAMWLTHTLGRIYVYKLIYYSLRKYLWLTYHTLWTYRYNSQCENTVFTILYLILYSRNSYEVTIQILGTLTHLHLTLGEPLHI